VALDVSQNHAIAAHPLTAAVTTPITSGSVIPSRMTCGTLSSAAAAMIGMLMRN